MEFALYLDYDNDGLKDLLVAQGHDSGYRGVELAADSKYKEPMLLARNTGKGYVDVSAASGDVFKQAWVGRGMAVGDLDNDGRIDAVVTTNDGPTHILHNETVGIDAKTNAKNHWLTVELVGHKSNQRRYWGGGAGDGLAGRAGGDGKSTAGGYLSSNDKRAHFGLGNGRSTAKVVEVHWPSGIVQKLEAVKADQVLKMEEPAK